MSLRTEKSAVVAVGLLVAVASGLFWETQNEQHANAAPQDKKSETVDKEERKPAADLQASSKNTQQTMFSCQSQPERRCINRH